MNGIDISNYQSGINAKTIDADFIIVKATEGTSYTSPSFEKQIKAAIAGGKRVGVYHYASGLDWKSEAQYFLKVAGDYVGKAVFVLDWESGGNGSYSQYASWCKPFLDYVAAQTKSTPVIYCSQSIMSKLSSMGYPMWIAQYPNYNSTGYQSSPWNEGAYTCAIRQYSSAGKLDGYSGNLDMNKSYITGSEWDALIGGEEVEDNNVTGIHMSMAVNTNRNKWKRENGLFVNMALHTLIECEGDEPVEGAAVRVADKRDSQELSDIVQYWDIEQFDSKYIDKYIILHPHNNPDLALTRTVNAYGAGVTLEKSTNELNQKWTAVWAGSTNVYRLFGVGTYYVLTADKE